jgi:hypothetical protein
MATEPTQDLPNNQVPGDDAQPSNDPVEKMYESEPLGDDGRRVDQESWAGMDNISGGGEFPDPDTGPDRDAGAPGPEMVGHREHSKGQFNEHQPSVGAVPEDQQEDNATA